MEIISRYLREQRRYTKAELASLFELDEDGIEKFIRDLKSYNVLKAVQNSTEQREMSDLLDADIEIADDTAETGTYLYVFTYVGVITYGNRVLKVYPKYLLHNEQPLAEMKQVLKVLEKYSNSTDQVIRMYSGVGDNRNFNLLAVILFLLNDYYEYGLYSSPEEIIETNGEGEIIWQKTIDETFPILSKNRPYYVTLYTRKTVDNETDFFRRLHQAVLTECSKRLARAQMLDLFQMEPLNLTEESIDSFGSEDYLANRILNELDVQFNTRKQILLKTMYAFITEKEKVFEYSLGISMFGTTAFNMVWEKACAQIFNNRLQAKLDTLDICQEMPDGYKPKNKLIDIIEKPRWVAAEDEFSYVAQDTLIPDLVSIQGDTFVILDAKYYNLYMDKDKGLRGQPGIESVTKQYLYQLAFQDFAQKCGIHKFKNCFLFPTEQDNVVNKGHVELKILKNLSLENIEVRLLPANKVFTLYLENKHMDIKTLGLG